MEKSKDLIFEYRNNPMHRRTIKLFRWHLDKQTSCTKEELEKVIVEFKIKYDVSGDDFLCPILLALTNSIKKTDLIMLIYSLGQVRVMELLDDYLNKNH